MWTRIGMAAVLALAGAVGCAERYTVPSYQMMRGDLVENVYVETADGYQYHFDRAVVSGDVLVGTLVEEVEEIGDNGDVFVTTESRDIELPISTVLKVEGVKREVSPNTLYVAGAVGVGVLVYAAVSGTEAGDSRPRASGVSSKPVPK